MISVLPPPSRAPFKFLCAALDRALGECIIRATFAATLKMHVKDAHVSVYLRRDRGYKASVYQLIAPYVDQWITNGGNNTLPLEMMYSAMDRFDLPGLEQFRRAGHATQDVLLVPSGLLEIDLLRYPAWPQFRIPEAHKDRVFSELRACRLSEDNWVCVIHYREPTYPHRGPTPYRDVSSDEPFQALARHIIHDLGGQVVRIGHREMRDWPELNRTPGFVDLSRSDDFMLHAAAVSISRFAVMTMGGPVSLCSPFGVPAMVSNAVGLAASGADPGFMLPKRMYGPSGARMPVDALIAYNRWDTEFIRERSLGGSMRLEDNTIDELKAGVARLYEQTRPWLNFWRVPGEPPVVEKRDFQPQAPFVRKVNVWVPE